MIGDDSAEHEIRVARNVAENAARTAARSAASDVLPNPDWKAAEIAVVRRDPAAVRRVLAAGLHPDHTPPARTSLLARAVHAACPETVALLLEFGCDVRQQPGTLLHDALQPRAWATPADLERITFLLLDAGAPHDCRDIGGGTILMQAVASELPRVVEELVRRGHDVNAKDKRGATALVTAVRRGSAAMIDLLVELGADVNTRDSSGWSPLRIAIERDRPATLDLLLRHGANPDRLWSRRRADGMTDRKLALEEGSTDVVMVMLAHPPQSTNVES